MSFTSLPPLPEEGELLEETASPDDEAPETTKRRDKDEVEDTAEKTDSSNRSPPSASSK
jgi:hypothetical protein